MVNQDLRSQTFQNWANNLLSYLNAIIYKKKNRKAFLHWTLSVLALEETFPKLLFATHWYSPLSVLLTFTIVRCLLSSVKEMPELPLVSKGDPFIVQTIVGPGSPLELQCKVTAVPSIGLVSVEVIFGWSKSVIINKQQRKLT